MNLRHARSFPSKLLCPERAVAKLALGFLSVSFLAACDGQGTEEYAQSEITSAASIRFRQAVDSTSTQSSACHAISGQTGAMGVATVGCAMAHCDSAMSDRVDLEPPLTASTRILARDTSAAGALPGLGCASNDSIVACSLASSTDSLVVYNADGDRLASSGNHLNQSAWTSAPIVSAGGHIIAADDTHVIRFRYNANTQSLNALWKTCHPGGRPISPVTVSGGIIVVATRGGPIIAIDSQDGRILAQLTLSDATGTYDTMNTPAVRGSRIYVSTENQADETKGRLYAIDLADSNGRKVLRTAWHINFLGPSGASPLRSSNRIYFDGRAPDGNSLVIAARDLGVRGAILWQRQIAGTIAASLAQDPRGGLWTFGASNPQLYRLNAWNGQNLEAPINLDQLLGADATGVHFPASAMSIAGTADRPIMLVSAAAGFSQSTWVLGISLVDRARLWRVKLANTMAGGFTSAQFPIAHNASGRPVVVFPGYATGVYFVGEP